MDIKVIESNKRKQKLYLFRTPYSDVDIFEEVHHLLSSFSFYINICLIEADSQEYIWKHTKPYEFDSTHLEMEDMGFFDKSELPFFSSIPFGTHRKALGIKENDYLAIITKELSTEDCFSMYDLNGNMVVFTSEWEYSKVEQKFLIAFTIVENIVKMSLGIDFLPSYYRYSIIPTKAPASKGENTKQNEKILVSVVKNFASEILSLSAKKGFKFNVKDLEKFRNDQDKITIEIKTSSEKDSVLRIEIEKNADLQKIAKLIELYSKLRDECHRQLGVPEIGLYELVIKANGSIILPDIHISFDFEPMQATLYIFFLLYRYSEGLKASDLQKYIPLLSKIYNEIKVYTDRDDADLAASIASLTVHASNSLKEKKSELNKEVNLKLLNPTARYYRIEGKNAGSLRIILPKEYIKNELKSLENIFSKLK